MNRIPSCHQGPDLFNHYVVEILLQQSEQGYLVPGDGVSADPHHTPGWI
jgi:hypothetical protein